VVETAINTAREDLGLNVEGNGSQRKMKMRGGNCRRHRKELAFIAVGS